MKVTIQQKIAMAALGSATLLFLACGSGTVTDPDTDASGTMATMFLENAMTNPAFIDSMMTECANGTVKCTEGGDTEVPSSSSTDPSSSAVAASSSGAAVASSSSTAVVASSSSTTSSVSSSSVKASSSSAAVVSSSSSATTASSSSAAVSSSSAAVSSSSAGGVSGTTLSLPTQSSVPGGTYSVTIGSKCTMKLQPQCAASACSISLEDGTEIFKGAAYGNAAIDLLTTGTKVIISGELASFQCY